MKALCLRDELDFNPIVGEKRTGPHRFWTVREEKILRMTFPVGGVAACLPLLVGRSAAAIYGHAGKLGLKAPKSNGPRPAPYSTSEHIDAAIRRVYQRHPARGDIVRLGQTLNRPVWWVTKRAKQLGLVQPRYRPSRWSPEENAILTERATRHPATIRRALKAKGFDRTETAINVQITRLGLTRVVEDPDVYTSRSLGEAMGIDSHAVAAWAEKGWLKAKRDGRNWMIRRKDIRAFIIEHVGAVDIRKVDKHWFVDVLAGSDR